MECGWRSAGDAIIMLQMTMTDTIKIHGRSEWWVARNVYFCQVEVNQLSLCECAPRRGPRVRRDTRILVWRPLGPGGNLVRRDTLTRHWFL